MLDTMDTLEIFEVGDSEDAVVLDLVKQAEDVYSVLQQYNDIEDYELDHGCYHFDFVIEPVIIDDDSLLEALANANEEGMIVKCDDPETLLGIDILDRV